MLAIAAVLFLLIYIIFPGPLAASLDEERVLLILGKFVGTVRSPEASLHQPAAQQTA